jgi:hypothetical protein
MIPKKASAKALSQRQFADAQKNGPFRGQVLRGEWWAMSRKVIDAAPPARTAIWEVTLFVRESEGHSTSFAASLLQVEDAFAAPKIGRGVIGIT